MIVPWSPAYRSDFESLNREWLERWFTVEPIDEVYFADPVGTILQPGGAIWFALEDVAQDRASPDGRPVGTVAAIRRDASTFEMAKMGVTAAAQGRGIGRALAETVVRHAAEAGAKRVVLLSHTSLVTAIRLYERLGFRHTETPVVSGYARGNVSMQLDLPPA
ncbi:GNAT family N-acetyltransferase [Alienimonas chondri]|uniref:Mycothiol acetyltransferase n=1 Tax=Alienimonas chondri TaxID=2681879 RepID=A0ABX1VGE6_9PLAN|nr:GNAT family N-acetyltransferase [Alienimonas chondri]NNJ27192.1 Mycothiol acetyltransferase [Alienimonas chondri]